MSLIGDALAVLSRLTKTPRFVAAAMLMLSLGIAISSVQFAVLNGVLGSLPFPDSNALVTLESDSPERGVREGGLTPAEALRFEQPDSPFAAVGYYTWGGLTIFDEARPREFTIAIVNQGFFPALALQPMLGRWFADEEFASEQGAIILSYAEWQRLLGGRADAVGEIIDSSDGKLRVIGVMPPEFALPSSSVGAWRPLQRARFAVNEPWIWNARYLDAFARLDSRVSAAQLSERLDRISLELTQTYALEAPRWGLGTRPYLDTVVGDLRGILWGALGIGILVMLIACANVAILIGARQTAQRKRHAVLQALGASRQRLLRELLAEIGLLTTAAIAFGMILSALAIEWLRELARGNLPRVDAIAIDNGTLAFAVLLGLLVPVIAALAGAMRLRGEAVEAMRSGRGVVEGGRRRAWLPVIGIALSTASVVAGSALVVSLWQLQAVEPGLRIDNVYALQLFREGDDEARRSFAEQLGAELTALPGVEEVAVTSAAPLSLIGNFSTDVKLPERDQPEPFQLRVRRVDAGYQALLELPLMAGRALSNSDRTGSELVCVINQTLARQLFGDDPALNRILELPLGQGDRIRYRVVGVTGDSRNRGLRNLPGPELLIPFDQSPVGMVTFLLASSKPLANYNKLLTDALYAVDPREASTRIFSLSDEFAGELRTARFFARSIGVVALAALLLAALGVYAVATLREQQRAGELGLRLAVGAPPSALAKQSLLESARGIVVGVTIGLIGAWVTLRLLSAQLFGIEGSEPLVAIVGVALLTITSVAAAALPAMRAARTDPMIALRAN